ncbi:MAG: GntR family transcriptional regulator [Brachybacterium sp.]|uniref:GntR family transcriptional regulator n=1 Tax=Brachybacterium sp. TaxID=1891286 RepID=UPI003F8F1640
MKSSEDLVGGSGTFALRSSSAVRRNLREHVYDSVLDLLLRGDTAPGTRLSIDTIARQLDVSPTPVREALVQLERTGLVTRQTHKGYRVAPPLEHDQLMELFEARDMLEVTAIRLAASSENGLLPELRVAQERHRLAGEAVISAFGDGKKDIALTTEYYARDQEFHEVIIRHSGNRYLLGISNDLGALVHRLRRSVHRGVTDVREAIVEHEAIIDALATGDPDASAHAMRSHVLKVRDRALHDAGDEKG